VSTLAELAATLPRFAFFTGKGGVGKTSTACALAVHVADQGRRVLLVSTDPASNLGDVFGTPIGETPTAVGVPGLEVLNVDPEGAAAAYRERMMAPVRGVLPDDALRQMEEQLSGACTVEVAAFDEFASLLVDDTRIGGYDHVLFDTAPTGHTLRLLQLPAAWSGYLDANARGASCLGPLSGQAAKRDVYAATTRVLCDPGQTLMVLVARPEASAFTEAERTRGELEPLGLTNVVLVVNAVFHAAGAGDPLAEALEHRGAVAIATMPAALARLPRIDLPLQPWNLVGLPALRAQCGAAPPPPPAAVTAVDAPGPDLNALIDELADRDHGLVMLMGKGGVGKTTMAAAIAVALAERGHPVHLTTTDPAAHLSETLAGDVDGLRVSRIDPAVETARYREKVLARSRSALDEEGMDLLEEDLRSPCTEEVAVFHAFSRIVNEARRELVIVDTAPTGHTLLLLDATGSYHREILRAPGVAPERVVTPLMRLQDPMHTRIIIVTLPEVTPVAEASALQDDLCRAGITPWGWVVNQSLAAAHPTDPVLRARADTEQPLLDRVADELATRFAVVPMFPGAPVGHAALRAMAGGGATGAGV
jgi:arsenite-transporting ATPase